MKSPPMAAMPWIGKPVTIDGNVAVPGTGVDDSKRAGGAVSVEMEYGGGIETLVGCGSVAVPGTLAAVEQAWKKFGTASWQSIFAPSVRATADGFPLSSACHYYLGYSGTSIYGRSDDGYRALHAVNCSIDGRRRQPCTHPSSIAMAQPVPLRHRPATGPAKCRPAPGCGSTTAWAKSN